MNLNCSGSQLHNERKRRNEEERGQQEEKRRKYEDGRRFVNEREREERQEDKVEKREEKRQGLRKQRLREERMLLKEKRLWEKREQHEKKCKELEKPRIVENCITTLPKRFDNPPIPEPSQIVQFEIPLSQPREEASGEAEFVELLAGPLHDLITAQVLYGLYRNFTPYNMSETVKRCSLGGIFRLSPLEKRHYCKQLYRQYVSTNMDSTIKVLESWVKIRILEGVSSIKKQYRKN